MEIVVDCYDAAFLAEEQVTPRDSLSEAKGLLQNKLNIFEFHIG